MFTVGIDSVDIERFIHWKEFPIKKLKRIFNEAEITYCLQNTTKSAERFAVRFSAKEAFYKAVFPLLPQPLSLLTICPLCIITSSSGGIQLIIAWNKLGILPYQTAISLTHTKHIASAVVLLTQRQANPT